MAKIGKLSEAERSEMTDIKLLRIGKPKRRIVVEPLPEKSPPEREPEPKREPRETPQKEPARREKVPG
jgi:hypothetical protein